MMVKKLKDQLLTNYFLYLVMSLVLVFTLFQPTFAHADWWSDVTTGGGYTCSNSGNNQTTPPAPPAPTVTISANPSTVMYNKPSTLTWTSTNATSCTASGGWSGSKSVSGSQSTGALTAGQTYNITCTGPSGSASANTRVNVTPLPTVTLSANPSTVSYNNSSTLNWTVTNATSCTASNGWSGSKSHTGGNQSTGNLTASTTYSLACTGPAGSASATTRVNVTIPLPTVTLQANPTKVIHGNPSTLTWTSTNATSCTAFDGWSGNKSTGNGTQSTGPLSANTQYRLVCTGVGGTAQAIASVAVETGTGANLVVDKPNPREKDTLNFTYNVGTSVPNTCVLRRGAVSVLSITSPSGTYQTTASAGETRYILDCPGNPAEVTVKTLPVFQET